MDSSLRFGISGFSEHGQLQGRAVAEMHNDWPYLEVPIVMSYGEILETDPLVERGIGLSNGANVGAGYPTAGPSQPYST